MAAPAHPQSRLRGVAILSCELGPLGVRGDCVAGSPRLTHRGPASGCSFQKGLHGCLCSRSSRWLRTRADLTPQNASKEELPADDRDPTWLRGDPQVVRETPRAPHGPTWGTPGGTPVPSRLPVVAPRLDGPGADGPRVDGPGADGGPEPQCRSASHPLVCPKPVWGPSAVFHSSFFSVTWISSWISLGKHSSQRKKNFFF